MSNRTKSPRMARITSVPRPGGGPRSGMADNAPWSMLAGGLLVVAGLRAVLAVVPSSWAWGLDAFRFIPAWLAITLSSGALLALWPPVSRRAGPGLASLGDRLGRGDRFVVAIAGALVAGAVALFPDRTLFVGDALIRSRIASVDLEFFRSGGPGQLLPIDLWIHASLPRWLEAHGFLSASGAARIVGAIEAAVLATLGVAWVRTLGLRGVAAMVAFVSTLGGAYLLLFGGYGKSTSEMMLAALAVCLLSHRVLREGRGHYVLGFTVAAALLTHRSALLLGPGFLVSLAAPGPPSAVTTSRVRVRAVLASLPALLVLVILAPRLGETLSGWDLEHHLTRGAEGWAGGLFTPARVMVRISELAMLLVWMAPLSLLLPLVRRWGPVDPWERGLLLALLLPQAAAVVFLVPMQGVVRDWDVFAGAGVMLAALCGRSIARGLSPATMCLGPALVAAVLGPLAAALVTQATPSWGLARARAVVAESGLRPDLERSAAWEFLGSRYRDLGRTDDELLAYRSSATLMPNPRVIFAWGRAAERSGHREEAMEAYRALVKRDSTVIRGWIGIGRVGTALGDVESAWQAAVRLRALVPDDPRIERAYRFTDSLHNFRQERPAQNSVKLDRPASSIRQSGD